MTDSGVWRSASQLVQAHPHEPELKAAQHAQAALAAGDAFNARQWERISAAVLELKRQKADGEFLN